MTGARDLESILMDPLAGSGRWTPDLLKEEKVYQQPSRSPTCLRGLRNPGKEVSSSRTPCSPLSSSSLRERLRLDQAKLDDVSKRISSSSSHAIFLALAANSGSVPLPDEGEVQSRPLRNLVSYLKQKEAAGVISLHNRETDQGGVLYAFPPCTFSMELLRRVAGNLTDEGSKDDHLVVVVVRGA